MTQPDPRQDLGQKAVMAGDPLAWTITVNANGSPVNLTTIGTAWAADLRQFDDQTTDVALSIDITHASTGVLVLSLTGTQTAAMTGSSNPALWYFDLQATGGAITPQTPFKGAVAVYKVRTHV